MNEVKQRWRLVFARNEDARYLAHLDATHLWERAFRRGEIPVAMTGGFTPRPRLIFAAPLPLGMLAEHELADLYLTERMTRHDLRERLAAGMPRGYELTDLYDEWIGEPALATLVVAADYRMSLMGAGIEELTRAAAALLAAGRLDRVRHREKKETSYDLRPLLCGLEVRGRRDPEEGPLVWMRLRNSQELGIGRADEVVAALAAVLGMGVVSLDQEAESGPAEDATDRNRAAAGRLLEMVHPVRERLWLAEELVLNSCGRSDGGAGDTRGTASGEQIHAGNRASYRADDAPNGFDVEGLAP